MWNTVGKENLSFLAWSVEVSDRMTKRFLPEPKTPVLLLAAPTRQLDLKAPASVITVATSVAPSEPKATPKPAAVQPTSVSSNKKPAVVETTIPIVPAAPPKPNLCSSGMSRRGLIKDAASRDPG